jgi:hypothetical protein
VYRDSTAVLGPLAAYVEPHCYDLCEKHAARLVVPLGWEVDYLPKDPAQERADDLEALANVVREAGPPDRSRRERPGTAAEPRSAAPDGTPFPGAEPVGQGVEVGRRGHLRVLRSAPSTQPDS